MDDKLPRILIGIDFAKSPDATALIFMPVKPPEKTMDVYEKPGVRIEYEFRPDGEVVGHGTVDGLPAIYRAGKTWYSLQVFSRDDLAFVWGCGAKGVVGPDPAMCFPGLVVSADITKAVALFRQRKTNHLPAPQPLTITEVLRHRLLKKAGLAPPVDPDDSFARQWSDEFEQRARNRLAIGIYRYGDMRSQLSPPFANVTSAQKRLALYLKDGNLEHLVDTAALCLLEYVRGQLGAGEHPNPHWSPGDDGEHTAAVGEEPQPPMHPKDRAAAELDAYIAGLREQGAVHLPPDGYKPVTRTEWAAARAVNLELRNHVCNSHEPHRCVCRGVCGCHWKVKQPQPDLEQELVKARNDLAYQEQRTRDEHAHWLEERKEVERLEALLSEKQSALGIALRRLVLLRLALHKIGHGGVNCVATLCGTARDALAADRAAIAAGNPPLPGEPGVLLVVPDTAFTHVPVSEESWRLKRSDNLLGGPGCDCSRPSPYDCPCGGGCPCHWVPKAPPNPPLPDANPDVSKVR